MNMLRNDFGGGHLMNTLFHIIGLKLFGLMNVQSSVESGIWSEYIFNRPAQQLKDRDVMRQPHRGT